MFVKVVTHDGLFHADEVFAIALLKRIETLDIIRTRDVDIVEEAINDKSVFVIDCGGEYNPDMRNFDHHQDISLPASNALIAYYFEDYFGRDVMAKLMKKLFIGISDYDTNKQDIHNQFNSFNKGKGLTTISNIINSFNRNPMDKDMQDLQFNKAVDFASEILNGYFYQIEQELLAEEIYAKKEILFDCVAVFNEFCPIWKDKDEYIFAIMPNPQGWSLNSKNSTKYPLPEFTHKDLVFQHKGKFIAVFKTKEAAIECASLL